MTDLTTIIPNICLLLSLILKLHLHEHLFPWQIWACKTEKYSQVFSPWTYFPVIFQLLFQTLSTGKQLKREKTFWNDITLSTETFSTPYFSCSCLFSQFVRLLSHGTEFSKRTTFLNFPFIVTWRRHQLHVSSTQSWCDKREKEGKLLGIFSHGYYWFEQWCYLNFVSDMAFVV